MKNAGTNAINSLSDSQRHVLDILRRSKAPLSAYKILAKAPPPTLTTPVQVYRALKKLTQLSLVHRVETLNKYVACRRSRWKCTQPIFAICDLCGAVAELPGPPQMHDVGDFLTATGFKRRAMTVEVIGTCQACHKNASA